MAFLGYGATRLADCAGGSRDSCCFGKDVPPKKGEISKSGNLDFEILSLP